MSAIGPSLPPHLLAKRKRQQDGQDYDGSSATSGAKRSTSSDDAEKRRRVMGPAMPPAPLDEQPARPLVPQDDDSEDSDDDFGPALPTTGDTTHESNEGNGESETGQTALTQSPAQEKLQRDDWMMMPPKQDDLATRLDPTKPRPKAFNSGKGARGGGGGGGDAVDGDGSTWHETAEQKRQRLADEMMGITKKATLGPKTKLGGATKEETRQIGRRDEASVSFCRYHHSCVRADSITQKVSSGTSLLEQHQRNKGSEAEDDPSKRAFDREKDMGSGMRISSTQRKELLNKAADFGSKFSRGGLL